MLGNRAVSEAPLSSLPDAGGGLVTINASPGGYTWAGAASEVPLQITGVSGSYAWSGTTSTFFGSSSVPEINATPGAWTWAGVAATISQLATDDTHQGGWKKTRATPKRKSEPTWFDYPDRPRREIQQAAQEVIAEIKVAKPDDRESLQAEAAAVSATLQAAIDRLELAADAYESDLKLKQAQKAQKQARELELLLIDAQFQVAWMQQQAEELDIAWVVMMIAAQT